MAHGSDARDRVTRGRTARRSAGGVAPRMAGALARCAADDALVVVRPGRHAGRPRSRAAGDARRRPRRRRSAAGLSAGPRQSRARSRQSAVPVGALPRRRAPQRRHRAAPRPALRHDARQRLAVRRAAHSDRARRRTPAVREGAGEGPPRAAAADDDRREPDRRDAARRRRRRDRHQRRRRVAPRGHAAGRIVGVHRRPHRHDGEAGRGRRRRLRPRPLRSRRPAGPPRRRRRAAARGAARHAAGDDLLRQPRGLRFRLDDGSAARVRPAARLRSEAAPRRARVRPGRAGDCRAPGLGPHARRALRRAVPGAARGVDACPRLEAPHPGLRHSAGDAVEQPPRRSHRRRGRAVEDDHAGALGVLGQSLVRPPRHRVRDLDLAPLAVVRRHAARSQGRGRSALPDGREPVDRPRLAGHARRRRYRQRALQLALLCRRRLQRSQPVVDRDARRVALPAAGERAAARGAAGQRRRALPADQRRARRHQAGHGAPARSAARADRHRRPRRDPGRRLRLRSDRRRRAGRARGDRGRRAGRRRQSLPGDRAAGGAHDAGRDAGPPARLLGRRRQRSSPPNDCRSARPVCTASRFPPTCESRPRR